MKEVSRKGASPSKGTARGEPGGRAPLLGTLKDMLSKAMEWTSVSIGAPLWGNMEGHCFYRAFEIKRYIKRYVKMACKQVSLAIGAWWGTWTGFACWDF
jgi:hypothetical protein